MHKIVKQITDLLRNLSAMEKLQKIAAYEQYLQFLQVNDPDNLLLYGYGVFSQNDEDGIIQEIFRRIGTTNKVAVEIAAGNGLESNTHLLLQTGWHCTWFEADEINSVAIEKSFSPWITSGDLTVVKNWVSATNIEDMLKTSRIPKSVDLLSLDIDGQEYWLWQALTKWKPRVIITEYNSMLGPDVALTVPENDTFAWDQHSMYFGASLRAFCNLAKKKGYTLVCCSYGGVNAFFIRTDLLKNHFPIQGITKLYRAPNMTGYVRLGYVRVPRQWQQV